MKGISSHYTTGVEPAVKIGAWRLKDGILDFRSHSKNVMDAMAMSVVSEYASTRLRAKTTNEPRPFNRVWEITGAQAWPTSVPNALPWTSRDR